MQTSPASAAQPLLVPKAQVSHWLLLEEFDKQRRYKEQLAVLEVRYGMLFDAFEARVVYVECGALTNSMFRFNLQ